MKLHEFTCLPEEKQIALLYELGVYIGKCRQGTTIKVLYQLDGFYAEVCYRKYRWVIEAIRCFSDTSQLDPYLTGIDVEDLVI